MAILPLPQTLLDPYLHFLIIVIIVFTFFLHHYFFLLSLQGPKGYQGPAGLPGEQVSAAVGHAVCVDMLIQNCQLHICFALVCLSTGGGVEAGGRLCCECCAGFISSAAGSTVSNNQACWFWQPSQTLWTCWIGLNSCVPTQKHKLEISRMSPRLSLFQNGETLQAFLVMVLCVHVLHHVSS